VARISGLNCRFRCDGEIIAIVEGSKSRESHVLKIRSWRVKDGGMPRPLVVYYPDLYLGSLFQSCFLVPTPGRLYSSTIRYIIPP
jgi:hypothetical protein